MSEELGLVPFDGYGTAHRSWCRGRVLDRSGIVHLREGDTAWDHVRKMIRRYRSRGRSGIVVRARLGGREARITTDDDGLFFVALEPEAPMSPGRHFHEIELQIAEPFDAAPIRATARAFVPPPTANLGVISDIDDTIVYTNATDRLRMARIVLFESAETRLPFSGVRAFYQALRMGANGSAQNPFFYVSSSSWHIYDVMRDFMRLHDLPPGPIILRTMPFTRESVFGRGRHDHKVDRIQEILDTYPGLSFLLIGDSGQRDAELYDEVVQRNPGRVPAIYLRDVLPTPRRRETVESIAERVRRAGSDLLLVDTTLEAAEHAAKRGWIAAESLSDIERDEVTDEHKYWVPAVLRRAGRALAHWTRPRRQKTGG